VWLGRIIPSLNEEPEWSEFNGPALNDWREPEAIPVLMELVSKQNRRAYPLASELASDRLDRISLWHPKEFAKAVRKYRQRRPNE
jgi:hypothetical protein